MKQINYFALKDDLELIFKLIESSFQINYTVLGNYQFLGFNINFITFSTFQDLPNIGYVKGKQQSLCDRYLITNSKHKINLDSFISSTGEKRISISEKDNPYSIEFIPSGLHDNVLLSGRIATMNASPESQQIFNNIRNEIKKCFHKVKAYYVGNSAYNYFKNGNRLACCSIDSPPDFDLKE